MKRKKNLVIGCLLAAGLLVSLNVYGEEFKTRNGIMTIEVPGQNWRVTEAEAYRTTLTDGKNVITLQHFSNGEKLPDLKTADEDYEKVCQSTISTRDEVFVVTGFAADEADFGEIQKSVRNAAVNQYGTKKAVIREENETINKAMNETMNEAMNGAVYEPEQGFYEDEQEEVYIVKPADRTEWVDVQRLNVRSSCSIESDVIGTVYYQNIVQITGEAEDSAGYIEWYRIDYQGQPGYVYAPYISPAPVTVESLGIELTDEEVTLYCTDGKSAAEVHKSIGGNWYDGSGRLYYPDGDGWWTLSTDGSSWTETDSSDEPSIIETE